MQRHVTRFIAGCAAVFLAASVGSSQTSISKPVASGPAPSTWREFASRRASLKPEDAAARIELAHWACRNELWKQAAELAREALDLDPESRAAYGILKQVDQAISMPLEPEVEDALRKEFDKRYNRTGANAFKTRNSRHFVICYDTSDAFAAQRGGSLEKAYDGFMYYFNMQQLRPHFLDKRLVVVLFKEREDFLAYAKATEGADLSWAAGYYSQRTNRSAFYDDSSGPEAESVEKQLAKLRTRLKDLNAQINTANARNEQALARRLMAERDAIGNALYQINMRIGNELGVINAVKTVHEAAHQLAFNTGIQTRLVDYPLWFCEGLACSFETEDRTGRRGPAIVNNGRMAIAKEALKRGSLIPVETLVRDPQPEMLDERTLGIFYAEGWALFHYLYKTQRAGMEKYLLSYQGLPKIVVVPPERRLQLFKEAFGENVADLDKRFTAYLKDVPAKAQ